MMDEAKKLALQALDATRALKIELEKRKSAQVEKCLAIAHGQVGAVFRTVVDALDDEALGRMAASLTERRVAED